jgi:hypothetical protein
LQGPPQAVFSFALKDGEIWPAAYGASLRLDSSRVISAYDQGGSWRAAFGLAHPAQVALDCLHSRKIALRVMQRYLGTYFS